MPGNTTKRHFAVPSANLEDGCVGSHTCNSVRMPAISTTWIGGNDDDDDDCDGDVGDAEEEDEEEAYEDNAAFESAATTVADRDAKDGDRRP